MEEYAPVLLRPFAPTLRSNGHFFGQEKAVLTLILFVQDGDVSKRERTLATSQSCVSTIVRYKSITI